MQAISEIIDILFKLIPFTNWFEQMGIPSNISKVLTAIISVILLYALKQLATKVNLSIKESRAAKDLARYSFRPFGKISILLENKSLPISDGVLLLAYLFHT